ncbi:MAG: bile acid:sodium symporter family protein [Bacteroidota bacterium]
MPFFFDLALPIAYAGVMFLLGLGLSLADFRGIFLQPRALLVGLTSQMLLLPLVAFGLMAVLDLPDYMKVGFVLLSACPGGSTSNLASYMLRGNVALSVSLTAVNSFIVLFSIPAVLSLATLAFEFSGSAQLPFWDTLLRVLVLTVLPCLVGVVIRWRLPKRALRWERVLKWVMPVLMAASIAGGAFFGDNEGPKIGMADYLTAMPAALLLNVFSMFMGAGLAWLVGLPNRDRFTIGIEVGIQNAALAITIASGSFFLNQPKIAIPAIVYLLFPFFTAMIFGYFANRKELRGKIFQKPKEA